MKEIHYQRALTFTGELIHRHLQTSGNETFIEKTLSLLDRTLGYKTTLMASLSGTGEKAVTPNLITHNVSYAFVQELLTAYWNDPAILDLSGDCFVLSQQKDYRQSTLYQNVLRPSGFSDLVLQFIKLTDSDKYLSYIIYLSKHTFKSDDLNLMAAVAAPIAYAHLDNIYVWDIRSRINILIDNIDHYPMGIMLISATNQVIHTNTIARTYLEDLGVTDTRLFSSFFTSRIYPYYMHTMRSRRTALPLQIGNYLFNVVSTTNHEENNCPAHQVFSEELSAPLNTDKILKNAGQLSACVYILRNELQGAVVSPSLLQEFGLTKRELQLAAAVAEGKNNAEIADDLNISANTVKAHLSNIYKKLGINYRTELVSLLHKLNP